MTIAITGVDDDEANGSGVQHIDSCVFILMKIMSLVLTNDYDDSGV